MKIAEDSAPQIDLFDDPVRIEHEQRLSEGIDRIDRRFGKHTVYLGSSFLAQRSQEQAISKHRRNNQFKGENLRKHLGLPLFIGEVK